MPPSDASISMNDALCAAAVELADLARLSGRVEMIVSDLVARADDPSPALLAECQVADLLSQRLVGVAAFLSELAEAAPANAKVKVADAVRNITLAEQARRLSGRRLIATPYIEDGELALFED